MHICPPRKANTKHIDNFSPIESHLLSVCSSVKRAPRHAQGKSRSFVHVPVGLRGVPGRRGCRLLWRNCSGVKFGTPCAVTPPYPTITPEYLFWQ